MSKRIRSQRNKIRKEKDKDIIQIKLTASTTYNLSFLQQTLLNEYEIPNHLVNGPYFESNRSMYGNDNWRFYTLDNSTSYSESQPYMITIHGLPILNDINITINT
jgi:hypothetical protein